MVEIKAGAELRELYDADEAVAKAIGLDGYRYEDVFNFIAIGQPPNVFRGVVDGPDNGQWPFEPSRDLRIAFWSAEKAGMFLELNRLANGWMATTYAMRGSVKHADTPALAICAAILALPK